MIPNAWFFFRFSWSFLLLGSRAVYIFVVFCSYHFVICSVCVSGRFLFSFKWFLIGNYVVPFFSISFDMNFHFVVGFLVLVRSHINSKTVAYSTEREREREHRAHWLHTFNMFYQWKQIVFSLYSDFSCWCEIVSICLVFLLCRADKQTHQSNLYIPYRLHINRIYFSLQKCSVYNIKTALSTPHMVDKYYEL